MQNLLSVAERPKLASTFSILMGPLSTQETGYPSEKQKAQGQAVGTV